MKKKQTIKKKLSLIYRTLLRRYGPQGWWPVIKGKQPLPTYHPGDYLYPKTEKQRFEVVVGAVLTQNTSWKNVEKAMKNLNDFRLLDVKKMARIHEKRLASLIRSSGYYNQKARRLKTIAAYLRERPLRTMFRQPTKRLREELLAIHGIGPETADSIVLYAARKPMFVVDNYTRRIFTALGLCKANATYGKLQRLFMKNLKKDYKLFNEYHALLVEHAKQHYSKSEGEFCPLRKMLKG